MAQGTTQPKKPVSESAAKMRALVREVENATEEGKDEEVLARVYRMVKFIESDQFDTAVATALLEEWLDALKIADELGVNTPWSPRIQGRFQMFDLLERFPKFGYHHGKFVTLILPLIESEGQDELANLAVYLATNFYATEHTGSLNT